MEFVSITKLLGSNLRVLFPHTSCSVLDQAPDHATGQLLIPELRRPFLEQLRAVRPHEHCFHFGKVGREHSVAPRLGKVSVAAGVVRGQLECADGSCRGSVSVKRPGNFLLFTGFCCFGLAEVAVLSQN